jgi:hypothetical protein
MVFWGFGSIGSVDSSGGLLELVARSSLVGCQSVPFGLSVSRDLSELLSSQVRVSRVYEADRLDCETKNTLFDF